jgi:hypothetical protein
MADGANDTRILKELRETISKVRTMSGPSIVRANVAEHLSQLTEKIDPKKVDDNTLRNLISLLDTSDNSVRIWVAGALGHLGPRAKMAVPALMRFMREEDCPELVAGVPTDAARVALKRIGVTLPPRDCGKKSN